jgi:hypothetical protein
MITVRIRRVLSAVIAGTAALIFAGLAAPSASAAVVPAPSAPTVSFTLALHGPATTGGAHPAVEIDQCAVTATVTKQGGNALGADGFVACNDPDFAVVDTWAFYNSTHRYALLPDAGTSIGGLYIVAEAETGGTVGHRTVEWCLTVTDNNSATGSGCLFPAVNI